MLSDFARIEIFDQCLVRGETFLSSADFICFFSHSFFRCDQVKDFLSPVFFPHFFIPLLAAVVCLWVTGNHSRECGKKEERGETKGAFYFFKKQENMKKIKVFSSVSPAALSGNISLDGFASLPSCLADSSSFFNISSGTGT